MSDNETNIPLFKEGDWVRYNGMIQKIRAVSFNESCNEIVYVLEMHNSDYLQSVLQSEAIKSMQKA